MTGTFSLLNWKFTLQLATMIIWHCQLGMSAIEKLYCKLTGLLILTGWLVAGQLMALEVLHWVSNDVTAGVMHDSFRVTTTRAMCQTYVVITCQICGTFTCCTLKRLPLWLPSNHSWNFWNKLITC